MTGEVQKRSRGDWRVSENAQGLAAAEKRAVQKVQIGKAVTLYAQNALGEIDDCAAELIEGKEDNLGFRRNLSLLDSTFAQNAAVVVTEEMQRRYH